MKFNFSKLGFTNLRNSTYRYLCLDFQAIGSRTPWDSTHFLFDPFRLVSNKIDEFDALFNLEVLESHASELDQLRDPKWNKIRKGILFFKQNGDEAFKLAATKLDEAFPVEKNFTHLPNREESGIIAQIRQVWQTEEMLTNLATIGLSRVFTEMCQVEDELLQNQKEIEDAGNEISISKRMIREELHDMLTCFMGMVYGAANLSNDPISQVLISQINVVLDKCNTQQKSHNTRKKNEKEKK